MASLPQSAYAALQYSAKSVSDVTQYLTDSAQSDCSVLFLQHTDERGLRAGQAHLQNRTKDHHSQVKQMVRLDVI